MDKYVFDTQHSKNKFNFTANSLSEFIDQYVAGVENTMQRLVHLLDDGNNPSGCSFNFYYYHLLMQVRLYYPNVEKKLAVIFEQNYQLWKSAIQKAKENGVVPHVHPAIISVNVGRNGCMEKPSFPFFFVEYAMFSFCF